MLEEKFIFAQEMPRQITALLSGWLGLWSDVRCGLEHCVTPIHMQATQDEANEWL